MPKSVIPNEAIPDGVKLSLRNSLRLINSARVLLDNERYASAIILATLSIEEVGKASMMILEIKKNRESDITLRDWNTKYTRHEEKIKAIRKLLLEFLKDDGHTELEELHRNLLKLSQIKMDSLYVDWDKNNNSWKFHKETKENAEESIRSVKRVEWILSSIFEGIGGDVDIWFLDPDEISQLFKKKKIHAFCDKCGTAMITNKEFDTHKKTCDSLAKFYWTN